MMKKMNYKSLILTLIKGDKLKYDEIEVKEEYPKSIGRYNEASLVKN